ncbi:agmatine/peptidylarginine deiminase [Methanogenium sp. MK-MG]|uniref:agmatine deiminase family protein n=1 Tax=Methanogenium sp. MK-MG TaxID=2599926 RepID=UPI0020B13B4D|nr:agmatine deiminase family protein [Methanogenium sp. MK-MG]KAF1076395.1 Agmatine deiminase [Methanogenium sp. MK-MG]
MKHTLRTGLCLGGLILFAALLVPAGCALMGDEMDKNIQNDASWRFPGEFEEQSTVWLGWLTKEYINGYQTDGVLLEIVRALEPHVHVKICVPDSTQKEHVISVLTEHAVPPDNISFYEKNFTMLYWRDFGPIFTVNDDGEKRIVDCGFNCWGYFAESDVQSRMMERIDRDVATDMGLESVMTRLVSEGGDREFNGKGTLITTEACEFQRNSNLAREEFENEFGRLFGATNIIWLKQGLVDDDRYDTTTIPGPDGVGVAYRTAAANNHVDEYCRFVSSDTILLAEVTEEEAAQGEVAAENRRRMEANYEILKNAVDQDGKPFRIVRMPVPEMIYFTATPEDEAYASLTAYAKYADGTAFPFGQPVTVVPAQSYCNFLISNGVVLGQKYWMPDMGMPNSLKETDLEAERILQSLFPDRMVVMINTIPINFGGGGIHCSSQQEP